MTRTRSKAYTNSKTPKTNKSIASADSTPVASPASKKTKNAKKTKVIAPRADPKADLGYVSKTQSEKALSELKKYLEREAESKKSDKSSLFDEDEDDSSRDLFVQFETKKYYSEKPEFKPKLIALTKPILNDSELRTCLFLRDHFIASEEELEKVEEAKIPTLKKILTLTQLKTIYKSFEKRRELYSEYDLFLVDDALLSSMPAVLGKTFYNNDLNKFPFNIRVASTKSPKELSLVTVQNQLNKVLASTAFLPPVGTSITVKIGSITKSFSDESLLANLQDVLKQFKEDQLITVGLKTAASPVLPLYYTAKIFGENDVLETAPVEQKPDEEDAYTKALLELADAETVTKVLGAELKKSKTKKVSKGISKP